MDSRYVSKEIDSIFSNKKRYWLKVEQAHLAALSGTEYVDGADLSFGQDLVIPHHEELELIEIITRHDVEAFVRCLAKQVTEHQGRWIHYGMASSDLVDTANALMLADAADHIISLGDQLAEKLQITNRRHAANPVMGRTHGVPAEVTTFGHKFGRFADRLNRALHYMEEWRTDIAVGKISGAVGTYAILPQKIESRILTSLRLSSHDHVSQIVPRDVYTRLGFGLADIMSALEVIAMEIRLSHQPEIGTMSEGFADGQTGSSAMPHKKNPIRSERICGLSRYVRGQVPVLMENEVSLWNERDISHSSVERFVLPDMFHAVAFALEEMQAIIEGLVIVKQEGSWTGSASLLAENLHKMGRDEAYDAARRGRVVDPLVELDNLLT